MKPKPSPLQLLALSAVLALALFFRLYNIGLERYGNLYYASTVYSMLTSWSNFFFVSFDPAGYVSVDKPPLGFWVQAASAALFGFEGWALMLPQVMAGVLSCAALYWLVARFYGPNAGILAALILAVTPIAVAADRNNTIDAQLLFTLLLTVCALTLAAEKGSLGWLLLGAALIGLGFNIKMLQAYMVLPAFYGFYLLAASTSWKRKLVHVGMATFIVGLVSFSWVAVVDLTPSSQRPYVGSSQDNTVSELIAGHNGVKRLGSLAALFGIESQPDGPANRQFPPDGPSQPNQAMNRPPSGPHPAAQGRPVTQCNFPPPPPGEGPQPPTGPGGPGPNETGQAGPFRLFNAQLAGQVTWLLPLALFFILALAFRQKLHWPLSRDAQFALLWGLWLVPMAVFFSFAGLFHRYYLEMLAPAIAALAAGGLSAFAVDFAAREWRGWLLPAAILASAAFEAVLLLTYWPNWASWLVPLTLGFAALSAAGLVFVRFSPPLLTRLSCALLGLGLIGLLAAPATWSVTPLVNGGDVNLPYAGPELLERGGGSDLSAFASLAGYLLENAGDESFLVAGQNANMVAPLILLTGQPAMAIGGFTGSDPILDADEFMNYIADGSLRYVLLSPDGRAEREIALRVRAICQVVPSSAWKDIPSANASQAGFNPVGRGGIERLELYDCR
jgi:4-amino-4-deoxy-L-arabinose transferase-like glycosyltransferase